MCRSASRHTPLFRGGGHFAGEQVGDLNGECFVWIRIAGFAGKVCEDRWIFGDLEVTGRKPLRARADCVDGWSDVPYP